MGLQTGMEIMVIQINGTSIEGLVSNYVVLGSVNKLSLD
jgi:hypothetical protein